MRDEKREILALIDDLRARVIRYEPIDIDIRNDGPDLSQDMIDSQQYRELRKQFFAANASSLDESKDR